MSLSQKTDKRVLQHRRSVGLATDRSKKYRGMDSNYRYLFSMFGGSSRV